MASSPSQVDVLQIIPVSVEVVPSLCAFTMSQYKHELIFSNFVQFCGALVWCKRHFQTLKASQMAWVWFYSKNVGAQFKA